MPQIGETFAHQDSGAFYRIQQIANNRVLYARIGDGFQAHLSLNAFQSRFRPATTEELELLTRAEEALTIQRLPANPVNINAVINAGNSQSGEGTPEQHAGQPPRRPRNPFRLDDDNEAEVGILVEATELDEFDRLVLFPGTVEEVQVGLRSIRDRDSLESVWRFSQVQPLSGRCVLNFYGPPGTGKTRAARAIARQLGKKLYQVDYSQIISKYYGDTAKHIKQAFENAARHEAILFFDEADALLSKRIDMSRDGATSINQNRNVLMQELDRFNGIVILSTNLFQNYDEALLRRVARHIKFELPNRKMRVEIYKKHIPNLERVRDINWERVAESCVGFSGGDILNVCVNAMQAASVGDPATWFLTETHLNDQIAKIKAAKIAHRNRRRKLLRQVVAADPAAPALPPPPAPPTAN